MPVDLVVQAVHTETVKYVSPEGEEFFYFHMECYFGEGIPNVSMLFNPGLTVGINSDIAAMMNDMFGLGTRPPVAPNPMQAMAFDQPINWDELPPPPAEADYKPGDDPYDNPSYDDWDGPDQIGDR